MITDVQVEAALDAWLAHVAAFMFNATFGVENQQESHDARKERLKPWMRAALEAAEQAAWQPIETAPKTATFETPGQAIEIFCDGAIGIVRWEIFTNTGTGWWRYQAGPQEASFNDYDPGPVAHNPTHWRPLPAPPADAPQGGK